MLAYRTKPDWKVPSGCCFFLPLRSPPPSGLARVYCSLARSPGSRWCQARQTRNTTVAYSSSLSTAVSKDDCVVQQPRVVHQGLLCRHRHARSRRYAERCSAMRSAVDRYAALTRALAAAESALTAVAIYFRAAGRTTRVCCPHSCLTANPHDVIYQTPRSGGERILCFVRQT